MKKSTSRALSTSPIFSNSLVSYIGKEKHATLSDSLVLIEDREEGREVPCPSSFYLCYVGISNFQRDFLRVFWYRVVVHYSLFLIPPLPSTLFDLFICHPQLVIQHSSSSSSDRSAPLPTPCLPTRTYPPRLIKTICPLPIPTTPHDDHVCRCHGS